jgi:hypothetical protein
MNRDKLIAQLLKELPGLLGDYEHLAQDEDGKVDQFRRKRIDRFNTLRLQIEVGAKVLGRKQRN